MEKQSTELLIVLLIYKKDSRNEEKFWNSRGNYSKESFANDASEYKDRLDNIYKNNNFQKWVSKMKQDNEVEVVDC
jgi:hypothetical protein